MTYNLELLKIEYQTYQDERLITQKQLNFVETLYQQVVDHKKPLPFQTLTSLIGEILVIDNPDISHLKHREVSRVIAYIQRNLLPLESNKLKILTNHLSLEEISTILKRPLINYQEITRKDYFLISQNPKYNFNKCLEKFKNIGYGQKDTVLYQCPDYEHGIQNSELCQDGKMGYLKFYDLLTLDYDGWTLTEITDLLTTLFKDPKKVSFAIYQTFNGYHLYYLTKPTNHLEVTTCQFMKTLKCDLWYIMFSHRNGFRIRLSPKINRPETYVERFCQYWGQGEKHPTCLHYLDILNRYLHSDPT